MYTKIINILYLIIKIICLTTLSSRRIFAIQENEKSFTIKKVII